MGIPGMRRLKEANMNQDAAADFLKSATNKFPLVQWTPRLNHNGEQVESLVYFNSYLVQQSDGSYKGESSVVLDSDLNQEGPTKVFTPMPNTYAAHWQWINLDARHAEPISLKVKWVSLSEINAINEFLEDHQESETPVATKTTNQGQYIHTSSFLGSIFTAHPIIIFMFVFSLVAIKAIEEISNESLFDEEKQRIKPMQFFNEDEDETELENNVRTRATYLR